MPRTQINFRLDTELLAAIKAKCEANGTTVTDFLTSAARNALGIETMEHTDYPNSDVLAGIIERIASLEKRLDGRIADREEVNSLQQEVEVSLGKTVA